MNKSIDTKILFSESGYLWYTMSMIRKIPEQAKRVFEGIFFDVYHWQQEQLDKTYRTFELLTRPGIAIIIPVVNGKICVQRERQPFVGEYLTLPSGYGEKDDTNTLVTAKRELEEETGYLSDDWELFEKFESPDRIVYEDYVYIARHCLPNGEKCLDQGGEDVLETYYLNWEEFFALKDNPEFRTVYVKQILNRAAHDEVYKTRLQKILFG